VGLTEPVWYQSMSRIKRLLLLLVIVLVLVGFDQATKALAKRSLAGEPAREYLAGVVQIGRAHV